MYLAKDIYLAVVDCSPISYSLISGTRKMFTFLNIREIQDEKKKERKKERKKARKKE
jgi:hypothetical protein